MLLLFLGHRLTTKKRKKLNAAIKSFMLQSGGKVMLNDSYIKIDEASLYRTDGTHLSKLGNEILLKNWKTAFKMFLKYMYHAS